MKIIELAKKIEDFAPSTYQEDYDNSGFQVGNIEDEIKGVLITIDVTEEVIDEAIRKKCNLIISHHPLIFPKIKKILGRNNTERCIIKAIQNDITIYSNHTNLDKVEGGVSYRLAEKLGLKEIQTLYREDDLLFKVATYVPSAHAVAVREAMFSAGAGKIGAYSNCSYNLTGIGTFKAQEGCNPFVGKINEEHSEEEVKIETIVPKAKLNATINAILSVHPYEEPAYDIFPTKNTFSVGLGAIGNLPEPIDEIEFLHKIKKTLKADRIRHTAILGKKISKVALCGGSGAEFLQTAINSGADIYISADFKYHQFFEAENKIIIADVGHFESEQFTKDIFYDIISKNNTNFAIYYTDCKTNPINYL